MSDIIATLENKAGDTIFPIAGGMAADSITTAMLQDGAVTATKTDLSTFDWAENPDSFVIGSSNASGNKVKIWHSTFTSPAANTELTIPLPDDCATVISYSGFVRGTGGSSAYHVPLNYANAAAATISGIKMVDSKPRIFLQVTNAAWANSAGEVTVVYISNS